MKFETVYTVIKIIINVIVMSYHIYTYIIYYMLCPNVL